jgi:hypothetical protein
MRSEKQSSARCTALPWVVRKGPQQSAQRPHLRYVTTDNLNTEHTFEHWAHWSKKSLMQTTTWTLSAQIRNSQLLSVLRIPDWSSFRSVKVWDA